MGGTPLTFPPIVKRLVKGSELTFAEGDANLTNIQAFCTALANLIAGSLNPDGTLIANSVGAAAIQAAAIQLANLNPALLYQLVPVDNDIGTVQGSYVITARGGLNGSNLIPGGAKYDVNGNYTLNGLTLNMGYYWTKGTNDGSCQSPTPLTVSGAFQALATSVVLTGTPGDLITATFIQAAPINAYKNGQIFFVYTTTSNNGAATLNVNNLGAIPIKLYGQGLVTNQIQAPGVFAVIYMNGVFVLFSGASAASGGGSGSSTTIETTGYSGIAEFTMPTVALAGTYPTVLQVAHGLGSEPTTLIPTLLCQTANAGYAAGQTVPLGEFTTAAGTPAFAWAMDANNIYITQLGAPEIINPTSGGAPAAITPADWIMQATAVLFTSFAGVAAFPAFSFQVSNPQGAFSYQNYIYVFSQTLHNAGAGNYYYVNQINVLSKEVIPMSQQPSAGGYAGINGAVFGTGFFTPFSFLFCSNGGIYTFAAVNAGTNYISGGTAYSNTGSAVTETLPIGTYTWTPGTNDIELALTGGGGGNYLAANAVNGQVTVVVTGSTAVGTLSGAPGTIVTGTLISGTGGWSASLFSTKLKSGDYKPCWYRVSDPLAGGSNAVYAVSSDIGAQTVSTLRCYQVTSGAAAIFGNPLDLTDAASNGIVNVSSFNLWYPAGSAARPSLFQYNPISKRIYFMSDEMAYIHIFELTSGSNDFSAWWTTASPAREQALTYVKSVIYGGIGSTIQTTSQCHYTVEFDQNTGKEICIVQTNDGVGTAGQPGSCTRVPWVE
jgi:hypothetical protein